MLKVVKLGIGSSMCCAICKAIMKEGEEVEVRQYPILFRWPKQRKKAKGATSYGLMVHVRCSTDLQRSANQS